MKRQSKNGPKSPTNLDWLLNAKTFWKKNTSAIEIQTISSSKQKGASFQIEDTKIDLASISLQWGTRSNIEKN